MRKNRLFVLSAVVSTVMFAVLSLQGQDFSDRKARAGLTIGPGIAGGASMTLDSREGEKIKPLAIWRGEVNTTYPLTEVISAALALGVETRATRSHHFEVEEVYNDTRVIYFSFYPSFTFSGFNIGFNIGVPLGGSVTPNGGNSVDIDGSGLPAMLETRLGGVIPLVDDENGWLSLTIHGGYSFSELVDYPEPVEAFGDWRHVSLAMGVRFEFLIPDTERD